MRSPATLTLAVSTVAFLVVAAGCLGAPAGGTPSTPGAGTSATTDAPPPETTATVPATTTPVESCEARPPEYDVALPDRPATLNESAARRLALDFERRHEVASLRATHENVTVSEVYRRGVEADAVDGGYRVRVALSVEWSSDRLTAKGGYPATYRVTDRRFGRENRTLVCW